LKSSRTQVCGHHGGNNKGPKTEAGKIRSAAARTKTGEYTKGAVEKHSRKLAVLLQLEDACFITGVATGARTRGRKPLGYKPLRTINDVVQFALDNKLNRS
jgi:hypothetical protein